MDIVDSIERYLSGGDVSKGARTRMTRAKDEIVRLRATMQRTLAQNGRLADGRQEMGMNDDLIERLRAHAEAHEYIANDDHEQKQWMHDLYDAADAIERLQTENTSFRAAMKACDAVDRKDAERYRWLRGNKPSSSRWSRWRVEYWNGQWNLMQGSGMDAAIDGAMQGDNAEQGC